MQPSLLTLIWLMLGNRLHPVHLVSADLLSLAVRLVHSEKEAGFWRGSMTGNSSEESSERALIQQTL